ncbi:hypothetical protein Tco_0491157 [Tanacetum coccineum]
MASFDYHLNPVFTIKECSSCGAWYNKSCGCSKGCFVDKFVINSNKTPDLSQQTPNCPKCGNPVEGLYCRQCALIRKKLEEVFQDFQDTSESSNNNTNVVNEPQEPFVVKQDPGKNSSPSPPQIDHCCHECGDSIDGIFCRQCTCKSCGKGAHYGYNCPPKVLIISNPEPCNNQTIGEPLQNLQSLQKQCLLGTCQKCGCNEYNGVCFYCKVGNGTPSNFSTPYSSNDSPSVAITASSTNHNTLPYFVTLLGNDSHYGYDCPPQVPFVYNQDLIRRMELAHIYLHGVCHFCYMIEPSWAILLMDVDFPDCEDSRFYHSLELHILSFILGIQWILKGKLFNSCTGKVASKPTHGSIIDITYMMHAIPLGVSEAGTSFNGQKQQRIDLNADALYNAKQENLRVWLLKMLISKKPVPEWPRSLKRLLIITVQELGIQHHSNEQSSSKLVLKVVPLAGKTATSRQELELPFHHHIAMLRTTNKYI